MHYGPAAKQADRSEIARYATRRQRRKLVKLGEASGSVFGCGFLILRWIDPSGFGEVEDPRAVVGGEPGGVRERAAANVSGIGDPNRLIGAITQRSRAAKAPGRGRYSPDYRDGLG